MSLRDYDRKRRFDATPEPASSVAGARRHRPIFVVQLHNARARHYDFRLEVDGALKSWAVPKGPSLRAGEKRLAVEVEDHPLSYAGFEGEIPKGNYGAGHVLVFDHGTWASEGDPLEAIAAGKLDFRLEGGKLRGHWKLVRTGGKRNPGKPQWLLTKRDDAHARDADADDMVEAEPSAATSASVGKRRKATPAKAAKRAPRKPDSAWRRRALALPSARSGEFPAGFKPELAQARSHAPAGDDWLHEVKWDGYRLLVDLVDGKATLRSRNGLDWTGDFPAIAAAIEALPVSDARLDGELVALGDGGYSDFALLQSALKGRSAAPLRYAIFDLPGIAGVDLSRSPLRARKALLERLLADASPDLFYSPHVQGHGPHVFAEAAKAGFEGTIAKRAEAPYTQSRSGHWIKVKHAQEDDFLIVGYSEPKVSRSGFGALLVASREPDGGLRYMGRVGTGFDAEALRALHAAMQPLRRGTATLELPDHLPYDKRDRGDIRWLAPTLVAEVAYRGLGGDGLLRQASFQRLRPDKAAEEVAMPTASSSSPATDAKPGNPTATGTAGVAISSRDRVVFPGTGITKGDVADYYAAIADRILPWVANRPLSLLRCPQGAGGTCFFQKHHADALGEHVHALPLRDKSGSEDYLVIRDAGGLLELVQMNVLEFHPWGARADAPEQPDLLVFDLDPGPGIGWAEVVSAAREVRDRLADAGLDSRVRLSGGKGLHVVVPIELGPDWEAVRTFCSAFAEAMAAHQPLRFVATMSKAKREGRIFIDWLRNARGQTSVCNWSLRARDGAPVAMPLRWDDLGRIKRADAYDLRKALRRAASLAGDPWELWKIRQRLPA